MAQVTLRGVNKPFGKVPVIRDVDLQIEDGEFAVFVGPSGCGKSTLLRLIAGLENLTSGEISIADRPVMDLPPSKRGIAMVFQSYALYPHMTVFHNMAFSLDLQGVSKAEIRERVEEQRKFCRWSTCLTGDPQRFRVGSDNVWRLVEPLSETRMCFYLTSPCLISMPRCVMIPV